ncbi:DUF6455 family protein [Phycobacter sp. K97]|jgi:hypothetical protein|uniref:DUF6455 family protein n=1 Tax=Phycobacter sedimenti TaxID=3133977 RepID=UPI00312044CA
MGLIKKLEHSTDLVNGMADRLGIDMGEIIARDPEHEGPKLMRAIMRCSHCEDQGGCTRLQAEHDHLDAAPAYCQNKDVFDRISRG